MVGSNLAAPGRFAGVVALVALVSACASVPKRNPIPQEFAATATVPDVPRARAWGDEPPPNESEWLAMSEERAKSLYPALFGQPHTYLAISGGGENGAFGAGLLVGWTESGDRPEFSLVTGISTGALIAPFAFLGPEYDAIIHKFYTTLTTEDIAKKRNVLNGLTSDAMASSKPLQELLASLIDDDLLQAIAAEHRRGRRLFVGTTNLDAARPVTWSIGNIAVSGRPDALALIRSILLASASLPGAFPPVLVEVEADGARYDELHVDGGATSQVFLYPAGVDWRDVLGKLEVPDTPRVYVVRNSKLQAPWKSVENKMLTITGRTISSLIRTQGLGDLYRIYLTTRRDGLDYNLAYIPDDFDAESSETFDPVYMSALFDRGYEMAKSGYPWRKKPPELEEADD
jgi:predicted acylesterase/phospholipase RssA